MVMPVSAEPLADTQARYGAMKGDVGLLTPGSEEWIEPREALPIELGDRIRTGEDGTAELIMSESVVWTLEPRTEVVVERTDTHSGKLNLERGELSGQVDSARIAGSVQRWDIHTPAAVVGIRGTQFGLVVNPGEGTRLGVFEGSVEIQPAETAEGIQPPVTVAAGEEAVALRGRPIQRRPNFSPGLRVLADKRTRLRQRHRQIQGTWSPHTAGLRRDLRAKFVSPPAKPRPKPPPGVPGRRRRPPPPR